MNQLRYVSGADISRALKIAHGLSFVLESLTNKHLIIAKTLARAILKMGPEVRRYESIFVTAAPFPPTCQGDD